ncbi:MAG: ABC transporter ATP-binding protein/permease [Bacilli bacterium]|nr:ABC transporter ATP-binding protein/permease [Bacilli bacterium]
MLELKKINKIYTTESLKQQALKDVSISFREHEFVSILGPSGSGKTTLLNIVGGLDQYTSGDLIINGISTKEYKDTDWDRYRNHSIGFVFQNYNLIPHQTVLANVELALTISGVNKKTRRNKAIKILKKVGLGEHIHKKPNQLSGGQMQRVAIARALINDPDILLADEPTGALDTKTSIQIMALLKEVSQEKLVIMVTHNPDLAKEYSTRIIQITDGKIVSDNNKFDKKEQIAEGKKHKSKKNYMSLKTALGLSFNNLRTKKTRTILTAFAGSIGIIGIALILSLSHGIQSYINKVEEDTLSSYPISIDASSVDTGSLVESLSGQSNKSTKHEKDKIYSKNIMGDLFTTMTSQVKTNDLKSFKEYLESENNNITKYTNDIQYSYDLTLNLYKSDTTEIVQVNPTTIFNSLGMDTSSYSSAYSSMMSTYDVWTELMNNQDLLKSQYDVLAGSWPKNYNEVVLIVNDQNEISDYTLYSLGILSQKDLEENFKKMTNGEEVKFETTSYTYDELLNLSYKLVLNTDYYEKQGNIWIDKKDDTDYMKKIIDASDEIKVVGIIKPNEESVTASNAASGMIGYTHELTKHLINKINESEIAKEQLANTETNIFTGSAFSNNDKFDMATLTPEQRAYFSSLSSEELATYIANYTKNASATYEENLKKLGIVSLDSPSQIRIYPKDFESKESITAGIEKYNEDQKNNDNEEAVIEYTDLVGILMSSVTSIVNVISYVLIAFVAISLIVSSIMIGIITYISVLERTKEIGILRAIGASKKDISRVFNAETIIEGTISGILGIVVTLILNIPINMIIKHMVNISNIAKLPVMGAIILIIISIFLTFIAGLIPSLFASKKDPVEALRTE